MRIIFFGAHPDDCDVFAGGIAAKYSALGHHVKFVSLTNGDAGHHEQGGGMLAKRRHKESLASANVIGVEYEILEYHDGELYPTLDVRRDIIRLIREWQADVVFLNRPNDYHPDHRYASIAVQDAAYMVAVPNVCPEVPALRHNPVFIYFWDPFQKPVPFQPDVVLVVDDVMDKKWQMMRRHESQFLEWLPYIEKMHEPVPHDEKGKMDWLHRHWGPFLQRITESCRDQLMEKYGEEQGKKIAFAECFELCEYGGTPSGEEMKRLFPFES